MYKSFISHHHDCDMSNRLSSGGKDIVVHAKYGMTWNAAMGLSNTEPSSSATMYAPPLFLEITINGPKYRSCIFPFSAFSIVVFLTSIRLPSLKLKFCIVFAWSSSNLIVALICELYTLSCKCASWSFHFCSVMAHRTMKSVVDSGMFGGGNK